MSLWQKTLFYLGLVDEDEAAAQYGGDPGYPAGYDEPRSSRTTGQQRAVARERSGSTGEHGVRVTGPQPRVTPPPRSGTTGEHDVPVTRRVEPSMPGVAGKRVEPPMTTRRRITGEHDMGRLPGETQTVRTLRDHDLESEVVTATSYSDAQQLADHIRASVPVVLDLRQVEPAMVRRLVDFASGLTYALGGSMRKIGQGVILVTPANVNISRDERRRLFDLGYYQAPDA